MSNSSISETIEIEADKQKGSDIPTEIDPGSCFVCRGTGHWARECTSLPEIYLKEDAPRCYRCNGVGHFARFCPTSEKQYRHRERRASLPINFLPEWGNYFQDLVTFNIPSVPDQIFLVRPDYNNSPETIIPNSGEEYFSDCSEVEYMIEDKLLQMSLTDEDELKRREGKTLDNNMIEISIETNE